MTKASCFFFTCAYILPANLVRVWKSSTNQCVEMLCYVFIHIFMYVCQSWALCRFEEREGDGERDSIFVLGCQF